MLFNIIFLLVIYILIVIYSGFVIFKTENDFYKNLVNFLGFLALSAIFIHALYGIHIYYTFINNFGNPGPRGIKGKKGKRGQKGICTAKCGQQSCVGIIENNINKHLQGNNLGKLDNKFLKDKINDMCFSNNYQAILKKDFENKPNEKEVIEYVSDICIKWIDKILQFKNGVRFLNGVEYEEGYFPKGANPFEEIKKYEIYNWGSTYKMKPIIRKQCVNKVPVDDSGLADLKLVFTNNYQITPLFSTKTKKETWGPLDCPYNQLGDDFTNPKDISTCYTYNESDETLTETKVWVREKYTDFNQAFSFYNIDPLLIDGKWYYQAGSVWCGSNRYRPKKKTVMLEYNKNKKSTCFPLEWKLIWTNEFESNDTIKKFNAEDRLQKNCLECVHPSNKICIWRPIAPVGYVALGDYVTKSNEVPFSSRNEDSDKPNFIDDSNNTPYKNTILCIKKDCLDKIVLNKGSSVWNEQGYTRTFTDLVDSDPIVYKYSRISIWPCGISDDGEELPNYSSSKIEKITEGGYNLFRANNSSENSLPAGVDLKRTDEDPQGKFGYEIKGSCYSILPTEDEDYPTNELGVGWLGGKHREKEFSIFTKLGNPDSAMIKPYDVSYESETNMKILNKKIQNYKNLKELWNESDKAQTFVIQHIRRPEECCENKFVIRTYDKVLEDGQPKFYFGYLDADNVNIGLSNGNEFNSEKIKLIWKLEIVYNDDNTDKMIGVKSKDSNEYKIVRIKSYNDLYLKYNTLEKKLELTEDENDGSQWTLDPSTGFDFSIVK